MNTYLQHVREKLKIIITVIDRFLRIIKSILLEQFNKNIYTRILFTNVTVFVIGLIAVALFSGFVVEKITYDQVQYELLRKAKRVNFALSQQRDGQIWELADSEQPSDKSKASQDLLKFLADSFDVRITIFDKQGKIISTSEEQ